jgi:type I restriction enzyme M protein
MEALRGTHDLVAIEQLVSDRVLSIATGTEVGKMAYGTGEIPFIRTSDLSNWEIKADFKHGVSEAIYHQHKRKADIRAGDILMVKDGTYLIGTTAIVTDSDLPMLFQSHIYRIRSLDPDSVDPWLLLACLNTSVVWRQIRSKQFTQDIIDTLGRRVYEILIPIPKDSVTKERIAEETYAAITTRVRLRNRVGELARDLENTDVD